MRSKTKTKEPFSTQPVGAAEPAANRVLIVDDHLLVGELVANVVSLSGVAQTACHVTSTPQARQRLAEIQPNLVVLDLSLPDDSGWDLLTEFSRFVPLPQILVLGGGLDEVTLRRCSQASIHGFLDKASASLDTFTRALSALFRGETYFPPAYQEMLSLRNAREFPGGS